MSTLNRPVLFSYNLSVTIVWACWYIYKTRGTLPEVVYLVGPEWPLKRTKLRRFLDVAVQLLLQKISTRRSFIQCISIISDENSSSQEDPPGTELLGRVAENTVSTIKGSAFTRFFRKDMLKARKEAAIAYVSGKKLWRDAGREPVGEAFVFNGRWAPVYMFLKGLQDSGNVKRLTYLEVIDAPDGKRIFESKGYPWELTTFFEMAKLGYASSNFRTRLNFFEARRRGLDKDGAKFVAKQTAGYSKNVDVVLFTSSLEEQIGFSYSARDAVALTKIALRELAFLQRAGYQCVLRLHPNTINKHSLDRRAWMYWARQLKKVGVDVIQPDSTISSYDVLERAKVVLTIGSTIGAESSYAEKVVFDFLDNSLSMLCGCTRSYDRSDCLKQLMAPTVPKISKDAYGIFSYANYDLGVALPKWLI